MPTEPIDWVTKVGQTAGYIWHALNSRGPMTLTKLMKEVREPRDLVMQALGWLAREGKLGMNEEGRAREISLR